MEMVHATGSGPSCEGCQVVQPRCRHLGEGPAWATGGHRRAGFISFQARERDRRSFYSSEHFSKVPEDVNTGSTDPEFVCTLVTFLLL